MADGRKHNTSSPVIGDNGIQVEPGDNSRYAMSLLDMAQDDEVLRCAFVGALGMEDLLALRRFPLDKSNVDTMCKRFVGYLAYCAINDERVTNKMAYARIGITKDDVYNWEHQRTRGDLHHRFILTVQEFVSAAREQMGADGKISPVTLIWWQKQYDHYTDQQTIVVNTGNALGEYSDTKAIAQKYIDALPMN